MIGEVTDRSAGDCHEPWTVTSPPSRERETLSSRAVWPTFFQPVARVADSRSSASDLGDRVARRGGAGVSFRKA